jgi:hypothetical protein
MTLEHNEVKCEQVQTLKKTSFADKQRQHLLYLLCYNRPSVINDNESNETAVPFITQENAKHGGFYLYRENKTPSN